MYEKSKKILVLITLTFFVSTAIELVFMGLDLRSQRGGSGFFSKHQFICSLLLLETVLALPAALALPGTTFCKTIKDWHTSFVFWIPILCYETLLCLLALYKGYENHRKDVSKECSGPRVLDILVRDSIIYFLA